MVDLVEFERGYPTPEGAQAAVNSRDGRRAGGGVAVLLPDGVIGRYLPGDPRPGAVDNETALLFIACPHRRFTLNSGTLYSGGILDLRESGPMVVDLPAGPLIGLVDDHHFR